MPPRTIDNLGMEVSTRYAEDQKVLDQSIVKEARGVSLQTEVEVSTPFFPSELEILLHAAPLQMSWASFFAPALYYEQRKKLFTFQSIPSLGSEDRKESQVNKILAKLEQREQKQQKEEKDQKRKREQELEMQEEEREKKVLVTLLQTLAQIDKLMIDINSRRSQYHKG